jgi:TIR domain
MARPTVSKSTLLQTSNLALSIGEMHDAIVRRTTDRLNHATVYHGEPEPVDVSVFAPSAAPPAASLLVQVFIHSAADFASVLTFTQGLNLGGRPSLLVHIIRGTRLQIGLDGRGLAVDEPHQTLVWHGSPTAASFVVTLPQETARNYLPIVRVAIDGKPVGRIAFQIMVDNDITTPVSKINCKRALRYRSAFLSYASQDRQEVLRRAQMLRALDVELFQDLLSLKPGDRWNEQIMAKIGEAELFVLFWSRHAKRSRWVQREIERAQQCQREHPEGLPDVAPVILDTPSRAPPPQELSHLHMNDTIAYLIAAEQPTIWRRLSARLFSR